jgi:hypothetical protein
MGMSWSGAAPAPSLYKITALMVRCSCGHRSTLPRQRLVELAGRGILTTHQLRPRLKCSACNQRDELDLVPVLRG